MYIFNSKNDCGLVEYSLLAAGPEDGYPPGLALTEVPDILGPMVPRDQTIVVSVQNTAQDLLDDVTKPPKLSTETNFSTDGHFLSTRCNYAEKILLDIFQVVFKLLIQQDLLVTLHDERW
jgi:hypothetical protein